MSKEIIVQPGGQLSGSLRMPGDKSISHRAIMLGAIAEGVTEVSGFLEAEDTLATLAAFEAMGVSVQRPGQGRVVILGAGLHGLKQPGSTLYLGNSGTSMRLLAGLLAGQVFDTELSGDQSLSKRPMHRIIDPLSLMGAKLACTEDGTPPIKISGQQTLKGINYDLPVASAQVKSCLLLAGLYAEGETRINEIGILRDHTERMLEGFGYSISYGEEEGHRYARMKGGGRLSGQFIVVPGDISSAAFFIVGACIAEGSDLILENVGINPTRDGVIQILRMMGADIQVVREYLAGAEPVADLHIRHSQLHGIEIPEELVPLAIDEFPAIFIAAACAEGETILRGATEMRVKESDRIQVMYEALTVLGIDATTAPDGMTIQGGKFKSGTVDSHGDHRIAMACAMAALRTEGDIRILDCDNVSTSFPTFVKLSAEAGLDLREIR